MGAYAKIYILNYLIPLGPAKLAIIKKSYATHKFPISSSEIIIFCAAYEFKM